MKSVAVVLEGIKPADLKNFYRKVQARRFYSDLDTRVFYFCAHSKYWANYLRRLESDIPIVAINQDVSTKLTELAIEHTVFTGTDIHDYLLSKYNFN